MVPLYSVKTPQKLLLSSEFCICSFPVELRAFNKLFCKIIFFCFHLKQLKLLIDIEVLLWNIIWLFYLHPMSYYFNTVMSLKKTNQNWCPDSLLLSFSIVVVRSGAVNTLIPEDMCFSNKLNYGFNNNTA